MKKLYLIYFLSSFVLFFCSCSTNKKNQPSTKTNTKIEKPSDDSVIRANESIEKKADNVEISLNDISNNDMEILITKNLEKINRLNAELSYLKENYIDLESKSKFWTDPIHLYSKKIILDNGSNIFGNIIYQDNDAVHVETLIGTLSLVRSSIIRVVDYQVENIEKSELDVVDIVKNNSEENMVIDVFNQAMADIILFGEFAENQDTNNNTILSGEVQNIGGKQADFIKINFTIYKDRSSTKMPKEYTVFINGSTQSFDNNVVSNSSLKPNEIGKFKLIIPSDFGPFISYSYSLDWEQYD